MFKSQNGDTMTWPLPLEQLREALRRSNFGACGSVLAEFHETAVSMQRMLPKRVINLFITRNRIVMEKLDFDSIGGICRPTFCTMSFFYDKN